MVTAPTAGKNGTPPVGPVRGKDVPVATEATIVHVLQLLFPLGLQAQLLFPFELHEQLMLLITPQTYKSFFKGRRPYTKKGRVALPSSYASFANL